MQTPSPFGGPPLSAPNAAPWRSNVGTRCATAFEAKDRSRPPKSAIQGAESGGLWDDDAETEAPPISRGDLGGHVGMKLAESASASRFVRRGPKTPASTRQRILSARVGTGRQRHTQDRAG